MGELFNYSKKGCHDPAGHCKSWQPWGIRKYYYLRHSWNLFGDHKLQGGTGGAEFMWSYVCVQKSISCFHQGSCCDAHSACQIAYLALKCSYQGSWMSWLACKNSITCLNHVNFLACNMACLIHHVNLLTCNMSCFIRHVNLPTEYYISLLWNDFRASVFWDCGLAAQQQ